MASIVICAIPGTPVAKGRPRKGKNGNVYTPDKTRAAELEIAQQLRIACPEPLVGPLELLVWFCFSVPKGWPKARRVDVIEYGEEPWHEGKPDLDNLVKLVKDAGNGILWRDDAQVVRLEAVKVYSSQAGTVVNLRALTDKEG